MPCVSCVSRPKKNLNTGGEQGAQEKEGALARRGTKSPLVSEWPAVIAGSPEGGKGKKGGKGTGKWKKGGKAKGKAKGNAVTCRGKSVARKGGSR